MNKYAYRPTLHKYLLVYFEPSASVRYYYYLRTGVSPGCEVSQPYFPWRSLQRDGDGVRCSDPLVSIKYV